MDAARPPAAMVGCSRRPPAKLSPRGCHMSESIGLSIGAANLVAARVGGTPVSRASVLTVFDDRASEVGVPEENPNLTESGAVMRGFVERVGDRSPLVAADGTKYLGAALMVEALEAMARTVGHGLEGAAVTIA